MTLKVPVTSGNTYALPPAKERCTTSRKQVLQRFAGWIFVIMGLGYVLAWLVLPVEQAGNGVEALYLPPLLRRSSMQSASRAGMEPPSRFATTSLMSTA